MNNKFLSNLKEYYNKGYTENGALTNLSTYNVNLDLFSEIGARRFGIGNDVFRQKGLFTFLDDKRLDSYHDDDVETHVKTLTKAYAENPILTLATLLYARDARSGLGERDLTRFSIVQIIKDLSINSDHWKMINVVIELFIDYGRWDDVIYILYYVNKYKFPEYSELWNKFSSIKERIVKQIDDDMKTGFPSLLGKWLPSANTSSLITRDVANFVRKAILDGISSKEYRKMLTELRRKISIIENNLREKDYSFPYSAVPSKAMLKYQKAFKRNDTSRYEEYLAKVSKGEENIKTTTLTPFDVVRKVFFHDGDQETNIELWKNLPDIFGDGKYLNAIVAADVSSSMEMDNYNPIIASLALAIYISERNKGPWHNHFIDFCGHSSMHELKDNMNIYQKLNVVRHSSPDMSTNIESVMIDALLNTAIRNNISQEEMPKYVIIISDMQFNICEREERTNYNYWKDVYKQNGYEMPIIVFWTVSSRGSVKPTLKDDKVILLSGLSQNAVKTIKLLDEGVNVEEIPVVGMMETLKPYIDKIGSKLIE